MRRFLPVAMTFLIAACTTTTTNTPTTTVTPAPTPAATARPFLGDHGFDTAGMDATVKPCDDFYGYATGGWRKAHPLDPQHSRYGRFEEVAERNREKLREILEADAKLTNAAPGSLEQKVGDFYAACMNETAIDAAGTSVIRPELDRINGITDRNALMAEITRLHGQGVRPLFNVGGANDFKNSRMIIAQLGAAGLGLPDRDYYLSEDDRFKTIRGQYVDHVAKMLALAGEDPTAARAAADRVLAIERRLAEATLPRVEMRKPENVYHITTLADLATLAPNIDWAAYLRDANVSVATINVTQPNYIKAASQALSDIPLDDWKAYLRWKVIDTAAPALPRAFEYEDFNFNQRILSGTQQQQERWKRCVRATDQSIGQLLGQEYVRRNFTPEAKAKMNQLIENLIAALREDIPTLTWMGPQTKANALAKLNAFQRRIGYPDKWIDYTSLTVSRDSYLKNLMATARFSRGRNLGRIGKPDDPNEWGFFTPPTVNAGYNPTQNNITFPAGILQPPFYDPNADDAYNYGGIGTVIGHEMTHGFDDQGAKFDAEGNLVNWWTSEDLANFKSRAQCIVNEYSQYNVAPGINIKGELVQGEAIADLGGATLALRAYQKSLQGKARQTVDGFTPEQRFFLGFAQVWGENMAMPEQTRRALTDPHAQGPFRVNGTVSNMPEFAKAFGCNSGAKMTREDAKRCSIW
jgi:putative endopeptidase